MSKFEDWLLVWALVVINFAVALAVYHCPFWDLKLLFAVIQVGAAATFWKKFKEATR